MLSTTLAGDLARRADEGRPVRVGLIGAGEMGTDLILQIGMMKGIEVAAVASRRPQHIFDALEIAGLDSDIAELCSNARAAQQSIERGHIALCEGAAMVCEVGGVDVVIDATGRPNAGAEIALAAIDHGKHMVMMNVEADVTVGPVLAEAAARAGVVYTVGAGDEPSSTLELFRFVEALGYPVVAAGKGKNNPYITSAVPDDYREEAERRNMSPRMLVEFVDGSKTMIEMTALANATGLVPDVPGMHGPKASLEELHKVLVPKADGGVLTRKGVVDYSVGKGVAPGIFVIAEMAHPRLRERMNDLALGEGPYYTFYRPYHLTSLEVPLSAAAAVMYQRSNMEPLARPVADTIGLAKRDLAAGETLDAIGETCYHGWAVTREDAQAMGGVPMGLLHGGTTTRAVKKGEPLTATNCKVDEELTIVKLRRQLDRALDGPPQEAVA